MNKEFDELIKAVDKLNYEFSELYSDDDVYPFLEVLYYTWGYIVKYKDEKIWNSDDDDRTFYEETNEYEPFDKFLKRKVIAELKKQKDFLSRVLK